MIGNKYIIMINIKNFLFGLVLCASAFQIIKFYSFYLEYSAWQYSDWLINYQGGFVRRGLIGEILFKLHNFFSIRLDFLVLLLVIFLYVLLALLIIKSLKYLKNSKLDTLIFLSPGFFIYPIMNSGLSGRKEILLYVIIGLFVFFEEKIKSKYLLGIIIFSIFFTSLTHSGLLFYIPYLIFIFFLVKIERDKKLKYTELFIILLSMLSVLLLITFNQGSKLQVIEICSSIKSFVLDDCPNEGQFFWLAAPVKDHIGFKSLTDLSDFRTLLVYFISLILVFIFIGIKLFYSKFKTNSFFINKLNPFIILPLLFFFTIPIYFLGLDWGRYISMSYFCSYFIYIFCIKKKFLVFNFNKNKINFNLSKKKFLVVVLFYSLCWTFPIYNANNFKFPLKKPLLQFQKILKK